MSNYTQVDGKFHGHLVESLDYIQKYAASTCIYQLTKLGIHEELSESEVSIEELVEKYTLNKSLLQDFFIYLKYENIIAERKNKYTLTEKGKKLMIFKGWFELFVGGYNSTFLSIDICIKKDSYAHRHVEHVSRGSCEISRYDAIPLTKSLMKEVSENPKLILDLGCGNGLYLTTFCKETPGIKAVGVEPKKESYLAAKKHIEEVGMEDRVQLVQADAVNFFNNYDGENPDFVVFAFVLHEILGQDREEGLKTFLKAISENFNKSYIIVIEVNYDIDNIEIMNSQTGKGYYNPYFLLHSFTKQKLQSRDFWKNIFTSSGFEILKEKTVDPKVDPTGLEIGYLLKSTNN